MKIMIYIIKEINERKDILFNIILGYQIFDICFIIFKFVEVVLVFFTGQEENKFNFRNGIGVFLAGVVGVGGSFLSIVVLRILGLYYLFQVFQNIVFGINLKRNISVFVEIVVNSGCLVEGG